MGSILQEGSQRRQTGVAAARAILPILLQMIEEGEDQLGVEIGQRQCGRGLVGGLVQQPPASGAHRLHPPAEAEERYFAMLNDTAMAA